MKIEFFVPGEPKPQPRVRAFARRCGNKYSASVYDPGTAEGWKSSIAIAWRDVDPHSPITGPISLTCVFFLDRPKRHFRSNGTLKPNAPIWHDIERDVDNYAKGTMDALTKLGAWKGDGQVARLVSEKRYVNGGCQGCMITIDTLSLLDAAPAVAEPSQGILPLMRAAYGEPKHD